MFPHLCAVAKFRGMGTRAMASRKIQHGWVVALGAGLFGSLLPGCHLPQSGGSHTRASKAGDVAKVDNPLPPDYAIVPAPPVPVISAASKTSAAPVAGKTDGSAQGAAEMHPVTIRLGSAAAGPTPAVPKCNPKLDIDLEKCHVPPIIPIDRIMVGPVPHGGGEEPSEVCKMQEPPLLAALRCYLENQPREALGHLKKFDQVNQELLICLLPLAVQLADAAKPSDRQCEMAVEQLESVMYGLRTRAPLLVGKMCLCQSIKGFGNFEIMPEDHVFQPGEQVRVYAELRNFSSERNEANGQPAMFLTRLSSTAEIRDNKDKQTVWKQSLQRDEPDRSQTPRHDYFDHYRFYMPELRPGWYTLEVTVEDLVTHRKARRAVDLKVGLLPQGS
jgi:hypothetical protein